MEKVRIIDELRKIRSEVLNFSLEDGKKIIEKQLSDNLEKVVDNVRNILLDKASCAALECGQKFRLFYDRYPEDILRDLDFSSIKGDSVKKELIEFYSKECENYKIMFFNNKNLFVRVDDLITRLKNEGLDVSPFDDVTDNFCGFYNKILDFTVSAELERGEVVYTLKQFDTGNRITRGE